MRPGLAAVLLLAACARDGAVAAGSVVALDYELSSGGAVIESSAGRGPLVVVQGTGGLPAVADRALLGLKAGDEKTLELTPEQGFGVADPAKIKDVPLVKFGALGQDLKPGRVVAGVEGGKAAEGRVIKIERGAATLDFNHPLAGKTLRYKFKVVEVRGRSARGRTE